MLRPCFLIVEREQFCSISSRKLVIETAKFNVLTAYSGAEAVEALRKFPNVDGVVLDAGMPDMPCTELVQTLKRIAPKLPIIAVGDSSRYPCEGMTMHLDSFDPRELLDLLHRLLPTEAAQIKRRERELDFQPGMVASTVENVS